MAGFGVTRRKFFTKRNQPPKEFLCPITRSLMFDPVVVSSGQTFERVSAQACRDLNFRPLLEDDNRSQVDFSNVIPNINLKSSIISWCTKLGRQLPVEPSYSSIVEIIRSSQDLYPEPEVSAQPQQHSSRDSSSPGIRVSHPEIQENVGRVDTSSSESSEASVVAGGTFSTNTSSSFTALPLATLPACYSCYSSSTSNTKNTESTTTSSFSSSSSASSSEEEALVTMFTSAEVHEQEKGVKLLRDLTRSNEAMRTLLCTDALLISLKPLMESRYAAVQTNALAGLVNLSLENSNKVKLVRAGVVPILVDILKYGSDEAQEHSAGALFSLALADANRLAIGANQALQPLLHALLRSESARTRHDSALALYNLSLVKTNRSRLINIGAVGSLMSMVKSGKSPGKVLLILHNLVVCNEGKDAMISANEVGTLVNLLKIGVDSPDSELVKENCVATLFLLSQRGRRFHMQALEAGAVDVLQEIEGHLSARAREKAKRIQTALMIGSGSVDDGNREGGFSRSRQRPIEGSNSSNF